MGKAERIEDLGKLSIMLKEIVSSNLFNNLPWRRSKDAVDVFYSLDEEMKIDFIHNLAYDLTSISDSLYECLSIANGNHDD